MYNLDGKVALVTGAGGQHGLGRAIALRLAQEGADLVINDVVEKRLDSSEWAGLPDLAREIEALGRRVLAVVADVSNAQQVDAMVQQGLDHFGTIDILVNNAGALAGRDRVPVVELEEAEWDRIQNVNVKGTFLCSRAVARAHDPSGARRQNHQHLVDLWPARCCPLRRLLRFQVCRARLHPGTGPRAGALSDHSQRHLPWSGRDRTFDRYGRGFGARWCFGGRPTSIDAYTCQREHPPRSHRSGRRCRAHGRLPCLVRGGLSHGSLDDRGRWCLF